MLLEPIEKEIDGKVYILSKFPAVAGRKIIANYSLSSLPKLGDYDINEEMMLKLMSYVAVEVNGTRVQLTSQAIIDNQIKSWETLAKVEWAMMEYNCSFFQNGKISGFLQMVQEKLPEWITSILTRLSAQSLLADKPL